MTVPSAINKSGPYTGNGVTTVFPYGFRILDASHIQVVRTEDGMDTVLTTGFTVSGVGIGGGGNVTFAVAPTSGQKITLIRNAPFVQNTDLENQGAYFAETIEDALDLGVMRDQQLAEEIGRSLRLPASASGSVDVTLPVPKSNSLIGWNEAATALQNVDAGTMATVVAFGTMNADTFTGDGATTVFTLSDNPGAQANLDVSINGLTLVPGVDYVWAAGFNVTFTVAPGLGDEILCRYSRALPQGAADASAVSTEYGVVLSRLFDLRNGTVANLLADISLNPAVVPVGSVIEAGGFQYKVAATVATNHHLTTTGGVKLYVLTPNVRAFGAVGDGISNDSDKFLAAHSAITGGVPIHVPSGTYNFGSNVSALGRRFVFEGGASITGNGRLIGALVERTDPISGARSFGVGEALQFGSYYRFGRNAGGPLGLTVGGGDPSDGIDGNVFFPDVYGGWTTVMPTRYLSSSEFAVQPASSAGACSTAIGGNTVTRVSGGEFLAEFVGRRIYIGQGSYLVATVNVGAQTLTVTNLNGSAVTFSSAGPLTFVVVGAKGTGTCSTNGTAVTRVSGDPFVPLTNTEYRIRINGVTYTVTSVSDFNSIVLASSAGIQTAAPYEFWTSVDDLSAAVRVHRISGAGFEENITIGAYAAGYFHMHAAGGLGRHYPLFIGVGFDADGSKRKNIAIQSTGLMNLGGDSGRCSLEVDYRNETPGNAYRVSGGAAGVSPSLTVVGSDTNIGMSISTKGTGDYKFFAGNFSRQQFEIGQISTSVSWLGVSGDAFNQPRLYAVGAAADIDIQIIPKGSGRILIGPWATSADVPVNGFITVKDSAGNIRKIATVA